MASISDLLYIIVRVLNGALETQEVFLKWFTSTDKRATFIYLSDRIACRTNDKICTFVGSEGS